MSSSRKIATPQPDPIDPRILRGDRLTRFVAVLGHVIDSSRACGDSTLGLPAVATPEERESIARTILFKQHVEEVRELVGEDRAEEMLRRVLPPLCRPGRSVWDLFAEDHRAKDVYDDAMLQRAMGLAERYGREACMSVLDYWTVVPSKLEGLLRQMGAASVVFCTDKMKLPCGDVDAMIAWLVAEQKQLPADFWIARDESDGRHKFAVSRNLPEGYKLTFFEPVEADESAVCIPVQIPSERERARAKAIIELAGKLGA